MYSPPFLFLFSFSIQISPSPNRRRRSLCKLILSNLSYLSQLQNIHTCTVSILYSIRAFKFKDFLYLGLSIMNLNWIVFILFCMLDLWFEFIYVRVYDFVYWIYVRLYDFVCWISLVWIYIRPYNPSITERNPIVFYHLKSSKLECIQTEPTVFKTNPTVFLS